MHCIDKGSVPLWILVHIKVSSKKKKFKIYFKTKTLWTVPLSLFLSLSWRLSVTKQSRWWLVLFEKAGREAGSAPSTTGNSETHGRQQSDCRAETIVGQSQLSENLFTSQESVSWILRKQVERRRGKAGQGWHWATTDCQQSATYSTQPTPSTACSTQVLFTTHLRESPFIQSSYSCGFDFWCFVKQQVSSFCRHVFCL